MTRFARAKGSKSSNERLPDEPTPWHVMKQQLEIALAREQQEKEGQTKAKSAKQLLKEKDDPYYAKSLGQVNTDWAEFENTNTKESVKNGKVKKKTDNQNKKIKKALEKVDIDKSEIIKEKKCEENKKIVIDSDGNNLKINHEENKKFIEINDESPRKLKQKKQKYLDETGSNDSNQFKDKKRKHKNSAVNGECKKIKKQEVIEKKQEIIKEKNSEVTKLSKRQKRNQKKQNQKIENESHDKNSGVFNVKGNDWNCSLQFGKSKNFIEDNSVENNTENNPTESDEKKSFNNNIKNVIDKTTNKPKEWLSDFDWKNWRRFGNNVPKKYQKKVAKVKDNNERKPKKTDEQSMKLTINGMDVEIVKYDGFPVKKEDAERLKELRKEMTLKGIPKAEIDAAMKLERRKCEKALARIRKQVCFHCRKAGHNLSDCPDLEKEEVGTGICFKCGSTEHTHFECKVTKSDDYRYAKCFICREQGHIAKQCPDNPKGLYPDGGCCKICGDVTHLKKDCPDLVKEKEETTITLGTINDDNLESLDKETKKSNQEIKPLKKIVKF